MNWKKNLCVYKLILVIFVVIFLPITFFFQTFWKQSFDKIKENNDAYYPIAKGSATKTNGEMYGLTTIERMTTTVGSTRP